MANGLVQNGVKHFARGNIAWLASGGSTIKTILGDATDDTINTATDEFLSDITGAAIEETSGAMTLVDAAIDGVCDASDVVLTGTTGDACDWIAVYEDTGVGATSALLAYWDTASGLPVTLGGDVTISWNASGLFKI